MKTKRIKTTCILKNVRLGYQERPGFGLWWDMEIKGLGIMGNPIQCDINFIRKMFELFDAKSLDDLQNQKCKIEYSYSPTFTIHRLVNGENVFDFDEYLQKCEYVENILEDAGVM